MSVPILALAGGVAVSGHSAFAANEHGDLVGDFAIMANEHQMFGFHIELAISKVELTIFAQYYEMLAINVERRLHNCEFTIVGRIIEVLKEHDVSCLEHRRHAPV
jgi:hypothetical protein